MARFVDIDGSPSVALAAEEGPGWGGGGSSGGLPEVDLVQGVRASHVNLAWYLSGRQYTSHGTYTTTLLIHSYIHSRMDGETVRAGIHPPTNPLALRMEQF